MPKKCFIPKCKSGYKTCKEKVSLFRVPNNETLLQQWEAAIGRKDRIISRKDHVCEKHFQEDDIIRYWVYRDIKDKLKTPRLKKNAVPSIFPPNDEAKTENTNLPSDEKQGKKKKSRKKSDDKKEIALTEMDYYETMNLLQAETDLFNKIWNNEVVLTVPTSSWALHKVEDGDLRVIILSDVAVINGVPCYQKQIIMNDDHSVSIIVGENIISQQDQFRYFGGRVELFAMEELNILINTLHLLNLNPDENETTYCDVLDVVNG